MSRLVRVDHIDPSPWADLFEHPEEHIARLAEDIAERGIQTPLHAYPRGSRYELLTGHDRLEAAKRCGLEMVPVEVRTTLTDEDDRFAYFLKDNTLRKTANASAIAEAALRRHPDWSIHRVAQFAGVSPSTVHAAKERLQVVEPQLFGPNTIGKDGVKQPAHKPRTPTPASLKEPSNAEKLRRLREAQASGSAAFEEPAGPTEPEPHDDTPEPELAAPTKPAAPDRSKLVPPRRPYTARMKALVAAAQDAADASDEEIAAIPTNDLMIAGLKRARDLLDRIITHHTSKGRSYVSA